ncbi:methyltransferase domain-containing protein [Fusarium heterosporum]|uniref:Methyltransferase domain-containing protein n=1 Tax=Fusarium heterosporum TaxID=42747 RepID=A0A8H5SUV1_FUSHE|nr:methyltransferase domain-containing protein [Fusarium heterosporum]
MAVLPDFPGLSVNVCINGEDVPGPKHTDTSQPNGGDVFRDMKGEEDGVNLELLIGNHIESYSYLKADLKNDRIYDELELRDSHKQDLVSCDARRITVNIRLGIMRKITRPDQNRLAEEEERTPRVTCYRTTTRTRRFALWSGDCEVTRQIGAFHFKNDSRPISLEDRKVARLLLFYVYWLLQVDHCNLRWTFEESFFGYIHARDLNASIDRREFTREVFKALTPGGIAEFHKRSIGLKSRKAPLAENSYLYQWGEFFRQSGEKRGRSFLVEADGALRQAMEIAGFEMIKESMYQIPIGEWPESDDLKRLGKFALMDFNYNIEGSMLRLATEVLGWSEERTRLFAAALREEVRLHSARDELYAVRNVVVGVKPS